MKSSFEPGDRERLFDAISLSQKCGAGKGSFASPATLADALRGLPREDREKFLRYFDRSCSAWLADLVNGAAR
jgi:hypothetical protein